MVYQVPLPFFKKQWMKFDDVLTSGSTYEECVRNTEKVLKKLSDHNIRINIQKCKFFKESVEYLGHVIGPNYIKPDPKKVFAIRNAPNPKNVTEIKSFMGLVNYYRKFAPMQATCLAPLNNLTRKGVKFNWDIACQRSFDECKKLISEKSILVQYDPSKELFLTCDASGSGVGGCLSQKHDQKEEPVIFASGTMTTAERNYSQLEKEALAIIYCVKKFSKFLLGRKFTISTDHQPLTSIFSPTKGLSVTAASRLLRWSIILSAYQYDIKYVRGKENVVADALSRLSLPSNGTGLDVASNLINTFRYTEKLPFNVEDIAKKTRSDILLTKVIDNIYRGWSDKYIPDSKFTPYFTRRLELSMEKGCLIWGNRVIIPESMRPEILQILHTQHVGIVRMKQLARSFIWWPGMDNQIETEAKTCKLCQMYQNRNPEDKSFSGWPKTDRFWYRLHGDFFYYNSRNYLLVTDSASKWLDIYLMQNSSTADEVFNKLKNSFAIFGLPYQFVSDNGPPFNSKRFTQLLNCNGIEALKSPVYYPKANGSAERFVETVKQNFKKSLQNKNLSIVETKNHVSNFSYVSNFLFTYRTTPSSVTNKTPGDCLLKQSPRTILSMIKPTFGNYKNFPLNDHTNKKFCCFTVNEKVLIQIKNKMWEDKTNDIWFNTRAR